MFFAPGVRSGRIYFIGGDNMKTRNANGKMNTRKMVTLAMLCALAFVVMYVSKLLPPLIPSVGFLKYDAKDIVIALGGFMFGPIEALVMSVVVSLIEMITVSDTGIIGFLMNVLSTWAFVLPAALIYNRRHKLTNAVIGLALGCLVMTGIMLLWNYIVTPYYMKVPRELVVKLLVPGFLPFNLIKAVINAALTMIIYKPLAGALRKAKLLPESSGGSGRPHGRTTVIVAVVSVVLIAMCVLLILSFNKII